MNYHPRLVSTFTNVGQPQAELVGPEGDTLKTFQCPLRNVSVALILDGIRDGKWRAPVEKYRASKQPNDKKNLGAFTPCGTFLVRNEFFFTTSSGLVVLDYDGLTELEAIELRDRAGKVPYTYAAFLSPSLRGAKVLVAVTPTMQPRDTFQRAAAHYDALLLHDHDPTGKDPARLCFVSYDPALIFKPWAIDMPAPTPAVLRAFPADSEAADVVAFTARVAGQYAAGNRNNFLFRVACNCNRRGYSLDEARAVLLGVWQTDSEGLPQQEVLDTLNSAYRRTHEHNTHPRRYPSAQAA